MPSLSEVEAYQAAVDDVTTLTVADLLAFWLTLDTADAVAAAVALREFMPDLMDAYAPLAAEVAAAFYDESRAAANVSGAYLADLAPGPSPDRIQDRISWAVRPLFIEEPEPARSLSLLSGEVQLDIADTARGTIEQNAIADPARPRYARHASSNACAFCALMASRGGAYRSEHAALVRADGRKYHSNCHCVAVAVFEGEPDESAPYVADWDRAYRAAVKSAKKAGIKPDLKGVLPFMRQSLGAA